MNDRYDVVILGAGPAGEVALNVLGMAGLSVALIEQELIGGECSNWGCIPSKTLLRPPELRGHTTRAAGIETPRSTGRSSRRTATTWSRTTTTPGASQTTRAPDTR